MRVTLADDSYIDYSTSVTFYLKLCGNLQQSPSTVYETAQVGCSVLCCILLNIISDMVLGMDLPHAINPLIKWNHYFLYMVYRYDIVRILGTKSSCFCANIEVCALKLV